jgi:PAS domain-containing protein
LYNILSIAVSYDHAFDAAMSLMGRIPPSVMIANPELKYFLLKRDGNISDNSSMVLRQRFLFESLTPTIIVERNLMINLMNPAIITVFGYKSEQLIGQRSHR